VIAGVAANKIFGGDDPRVIWTVANITEPIGTLFLRLLLMIVVPLVFSSLVVGVAGIGDVRKLGRIGLKCFGYTFVISAISVVIGLTVTNLIRRASGWMRRRGLASKNATAAMPPSRSRLRQQKRHRRSPRSCRS
jgi:DAACS family dicarboxylate/amino acid:cation (Na+ or H+) symporter